jgi:iron complex transport system permease protein
MKPWPPLRFFVVIVTITLLLGVWGLGVGSTGWQSVWMLWAPTHTTQEASTTAIQIIREIRMPRLLGAWLAGALLGLAGAIAQGLFRNPLADPYLLGSASGASLGVALALVVPTWLGSRVGSVAWAHVWVQMGLTSAAFVGAMVAVLLALCLARGVQQTMRLLLGGVVLGVVLGALAQLVLLLSPQALPQMQAFLLGSTAWLGWTACAVMLGVWVLGVCAAIALARALDALSLGDATAQSLGLPLDAMRLGLVAILALATGTAVAQTGLIAFVGLAAPHCVRAFVQVSYARMLGFASAVGGLLLMAADILARACLAPEELPVGLVTAILGGAYWCFLLYARGRNSQGAFP